MALDQGAWAPVFIASMITLLTAIDGGRGPEVKAALQSDWASSVKANWVLWVPAQFLNFRYARPAARASGVGRHVAHLVGCSITQRMQIGYAVSTCSRAALPECAAGCSKPPTPPRHACPPLTGAPQVRRAAAPAAVRQRYRAGLERLVLVPHAPQGGDGVSAQAVALGSPSPCRARGVRGCKALLPASRAFCEQRRLDGPTALWSVRNRQAGGSGQGLAPTQPARAASHAPRCSGVLRRLPALEGLCPACPVFGFLYLRFNARMMRLAGPAGL